MSLAPGEQATIIGIGVAAALGLGAFIARAATMRGDVNARWARRVQFATAALDERTVAELQRLRDDINDVLPKEDTADEETLFDPTEAILDPGALTGQAQQIADLHRASHRMERNKAWLMALGRGVTAALVVLLAGVAALTASYGELVEWKWLDTAGLVVCVVGVLALGVQGAAFVVLQDHMASDEDLAGTAGRADTDGA